MLKKLLGVIALSMVLLLPVKAGAATINPKCEKSCPTENGKCTSVCTISVAGNTGSLTEFKATLNIVGDGVTVTKITPGTGWTNLTASTTGKSIPLDFLASTAVTTSDFVLATINLELESSATNCSLKLSNPSVGTEVTTVIETTTETKTGATIPLAIIACGAVVAVVIYGATKKNKKMYKI